MKTPPDHPSCRDPFDDILNAVISGDASAQDNALLNDTLRADPEARRAYIRTMAFEAMLAREFAPIEETATPPRRRRWLAPLSIAATILLASALAWKLSSVPAPDIDAANGTDVDITHAVITSLDEANGRFGGVTLVQGQRLTEGMLELDSGFAEITFDTGAEVTLEGPARFLLESEKKSRLDSGRASAHVPEQARGFVIHTPSSYIRDLGTAFAVEVRDGKETDLHVLEGEVEVAATGRKNTKPPRILRQKESVRLAGGEMQPISFRETYPRNRNPKRAHKVPPSVHWSFDSWDGSITTDTTRGHQLKLLRDKKTTEPEIIEGPFGTALHLDGAGTIARSDYPGVGGSQARTIACWVRIQPDGGTQAKPNGIIAWGLNRSSGKWQIGWNTISDQGNIGAPRVEFGEGFLVGSTDLRDGRWHHLAVVYLGGPKANVATHVRIYVDGKLEAPGGRRRQRIDTDTRSADARRLTLGRYFGRHSEKEGLNFEGDLDEVHIFEGPLLPKQIDRLMKRNTAQAAKP
jgi:hypothetical protein